MPTVRPAKTCCKAKPPEPPKTIGQLQEQIGRTKDELEYRWTHGAVRKYGNVHRAIGLLQQKGIRDYNAFNDLLLGKGWEALPPEFVEVVSSMAKCVREKFWDVQAGKVLSQSVKD